MSSRRRWGIVLGCCAGVLSLVLAGNLLLSRRNAAAAPAAADRVADEAPGALVEAASAQAAGPATAIEPDEPTTAAPATVPATKPTITEGSDTPIATTPTVKVKPVTSSAPTAKPRLDRNKPGTVHVREEGFSIVPPAGWSRVNKGRPAFLVYAKSPRDGFAANFNVGSEPDDGHSLKAEAAAAKALLPKVLNAWHFKAERFLEINGRPAYCILSDYQVNSVKVLLLQYVLKGDNKKIYTLTFACGPGEFDSLKRTLNDCAQTMLID